MNCLIGHTGFIGKNLLNQIKFDKLYNSKNINTIKGENFDLLICAGAPGIKWEANNNPKKDLNSINQLIDNIDKINCKMFILISTVDVYHNPINVTEDNLIELLINRGYNVVERDPDALNNLYRESSLKFKKENPKYNNLNSIDNLDKLAGPNIEARGSVISKNSVEEFIETQINSAT